MGGVCSWLWSSPDSLYECQAAGMNRRAPTVRVSFNDMLDFCGKFKEWLSLCVRSEDDNGSTSSLNCSHRYCKNDNAHIFLHLAFV